MLIFTSVYLSGPNQPILFENRSFPVSQSQIKSNFLAGLLAELAAVAADLPSGGPTKDALPENFVDIGTVSDSQTKALHFMMERCVADLRGLKIEGYELKAKQTRDQLPYEPETRSIAKRGHLLRIRHDFLAELFNAALHTDFFDEFPIGVTSQMVLGPNWEIGYTAKTPDPFASGLLERLLASGVRVFDLGNLSR